MASDSRDSCLLLVPLLTKQWNPLIAPQAIVINKNGRMGGASDGGDVTIAGAEAIKSADPLKHATIRPVTSSASAKSNCWLLT